MTEPAYFAKMSEANRQLLGSIYFVAGIMALGGVFGVMNTMFAAIRRAPRTSASCASSASPAGKCSCHSCSKH